MRLEGSQTPGEGDILIRDEKGLIASICGSTWDLAAANVTCKQLGYEEGAFAYTRLSSYFTYSRVYAYTYGHCNGTESRLQDCVLLNDTSSCGGYVDGNGAVCKGKT